MAGCEADIVFVGHTHEAMIRQVGATIVVNLGSVSNPRGPDARASYVVMELGPGEVNFSHRRVAYDHDAFARSMESARHPSVDYIMSYQRGEQPGRSPHADHVPLRLGETTRVVCPAVAPDVT